MNWPVQGGDESPLQVGVLHIGTPLHSQIVPGILAQHLRTAAILYPGPIKALAKTACPPD